MQSFKEHLLERSLTPDEEKKKEEIVKALKKDGDQDIDSIHAVATAQAKKAV